MSEDHRILMCAENLHEGMALGPIHYVVSGEQVNAFAAALKSGNPMFTDAASGGQLAPPTMRLNDYALLIAEHFRGGSGGVHAKHKCELFEPMRVGQAIKATGRITRTYHKRGKFYFELEYEARDAVSDTLLTRQMITSVLLQKGEMQ
ncbi:MAG: MaoC family dehydratase N-terminal domain-containing protein [Candidatus Binatales bacterium]